MNKILFIFTIITFLIIPLYSNDFQDTNIKFLPGSNIYVRIFLFYFPLSKQYEVFFNLQDEYFNLDIFIKENNIIKEPYTKSYFDSDILFRINKIKYYKSKELIIPITIRCNKKFITKKALIIINCKENILIIKGQINDLEIGEITEDEYFKKRYKWKLPFYFDIRLQLSKNLLEDILKINNN